MHDLYKLYEPPDEHTGGDASVSEGRESFADLVNRAAYRKERIVVTRHGKRIAAIIPIEQVEFLERAENAYDVRMAEEARRELDETPGIPWEQVKRDLDL